MKMQKNVYPAEYLEFIHLFNEGKFFEAHEVLELLWRREKGEVRDFYHGLIQIAAVFVHLRKKTPEGGKQLLNKASKYLEKYRPVFMGMDLERLLIQTRASLVDHAEFPILFSQGVDS